MFHWCPQETAAALACLSVVPLLGSWIKHKISKMKSHCCNENHSNKSTKELTKERFLEYLIKQKACQEGFDWAKAQVSARDIVEKCTNVDHLCWLIDAIGGPMDDEYLEKQTPLRAEYEKNRAPILADYEEKIAPIWADYEEKRYVIIKGICTFERVQEAIGE